MANLLLLSAVLLSETAALFYPTANGGVSQGKNPFFFIFLLFAFWSKLRYNGNIFIKNAEISNFITKLKHF